MAHMPKSLLFALLILAGPTLPPATLHAQSAADSAAVRRVAADYIDGWYSGDADRMASALHPELAKRIVLATPGGASRLDNMTAAALVSATRGRPAGGTGRSEVRILDMFGNTASVRVDAESWIDYMHLAKWNGEWKIVNVLWEQRRN